MTANIVLDRAGRVVIPKALREELNLGPGDSFQLESHGEQITLRPVRATMPIRKEDGVWVYRAGQATDLSLQELIDQDREERHNRVVSSGK